MHHNLHSERRGMSNGAVFPERIVMRAFPGKKATLTSKSTSAVFRSLVMGISFEQNTRGMPRSSFGTFWLELNSDRKANQIQGYLS